MAGDNRLLRKVRNLSDLELAFLLCLIAREHCLINTLPSAVDELVEELRLVSTKTFRLQPVIVSCHAHTTLDDFATALLLPWSPLSNHSSPSPYRPRSSRHDPSSPCLSYFVSQPSGGGGGPSVSGIAGPSNRSHPQHYHHYHHHNQQQHPQPHPFSSLTPTSPGAGAGSGSGQIANVVIAVNLDRASKAVQTQALELLRTRRIFTRTAVRAAPNQFLLVAIVAADGGGAAAAPHLTTHLNDWLYIAHWHDPEDGYANLDEEWEGGKEEDKDSDGDVDLGPYYAPGSGSGAGGDEASTASRDSVVKTVLSGAGGLGLGTGSSSGPVVAGGSGSKPLTGHEEREQEEEADGQEAAAVTERDILRLAQLGQQVQMDVDVRRYQMNIVSFLRMHRAVAGGITPVATKHFEQLMKSLAPLHGLDYVIPSLVGLAARKIYLHRIRIVEPERERSLQWGSELTAIEALLEGVGPEDVIDDVLGMVAVPL